MLGENEDVDAENESSEAEGTMGDSVSTGSSTSPDSSSETSSSSTSPSRRLELDGLEGLEKELTAVADRLKVVEDQASKFEERDRRTIETLGIFVALFTFISVEFQLFNVLKTGSAVIGLTLVLFGALLSFLFLLKNEVAWLAWSISSILLGVAIFLLGPYLSYG